MWQKKEREALAYCTQAHTGGPLHHHNTKWSQRQKQKPQRHKMCIKKQVQNTQKTTHDYRLRQNPNKDSKNCAKKPHKKTKQH